MSGKQAINHILENVPKMPGIYKMLDKDQRILYIGKAKNLYKRLSYYIKDNLTDRLSKMIFLTHEVEYILTSNETNALLLEATLIKKFQPKFNILLKDDKSFCYIHIDYNHDFPRLAKFRGRTLSKGKFFGPFASSHDVNEAVTELQKIFKLRPCSDKLFLNRVRPCLQYQINRCCAPCVQKITSDKYFELLNQAFDFLAGKNQKLQQELSRKMSELSENMQYEQAAEIRDRIKALSYVQLKSIQYIGIEDTDVIAVVESNGVFCVQVFIYRAGKNYGNKSYFPIHTDDVSKEEVMLNFIMQFYQSNLPPTSLIINYEIKDQIILQEAFKTLYGHKVAILFPRRGKKVQLLRNAERNAIVVLKAKVANTLKQQQILESIQKMFQVKHAIQRIEVYDNSHIMGNFAVGVMVVAGASGLLKSEYRRFNIKNINPNSYGGDDYKMLSEVMSRRLKGIKNNPDKIPDLMIIDGGKGHLTVVDKIMKQYELNIPFVCMSKGVDRNAGKEEFHIIGQESFRLAYNSQILHYIQVLRDEAHNFAIKNHRQKRAKSIKKSTIDDVVGIGQKRKKALLNYFGSVQEIKNATISELLKVHGINKFIAEKLFQALHPGSD